MTAPAGWEVAAMRDSAHLIDHAQTCRRPAPLLRLSWDRLPELWCAGCGRCAPAPDGREVAR